MGTPKFKFKNRQDWLLHCKNAAADFLANKRDRSHMWIEHVRVAPPGQQDLLDCHGRMRSYNLSGTLARKGTPRKGPPRGTVVIWRANGYWWIGASFCDARDARRYNRHEGIYRAIHDAKKLTRWVDFNGYHLTCLSWLEDLPLSCRHTAHRILSRIQRQHKLGFLGGQEIDAVTFDRPQGATSGVT